MNWAALSFGKVWFMVQPRVARPREQIALWFYTTAVDDIYALFRNRQLDASKATLSGSSPHSRRFASSKICTTRSTADGSSACSHPNGFELVFYSEPSSA